MWLTRPLKDQSESIMGSGSFVSASFDYMFVERLSGLSESAGGLGKVFSFESGDVNVTQTIGTSSPESLAATAAILPSFNWDSVIVLSANQSESAAASSGPPAFNWDYIIVNNAATQSESASVLAGAPTFNHN